MIVEKISDDVWIVVIFFSYPEIVGSSRNSFRASFVRVFRWLSTECARGLTQVTEPYQTPNAGK